ncbi:hypothetical protein R6Q59_017733 [Mikania micrantha]
MFHYKDHMHMTFFWSKDVVMLFNGWPNGKLGMYILALAIVFILAAMVEFLSVFPGVKPGCNLVIRGLIHALLHGLRMAFVYLLMLCVMSYNIGVFVSVVVGHVIGCFLVKYWAMFKATSKSQTDIV